MNILIIEDEHTAAQRLQNMLREMDKDIAIVNVLDSVEASITFLRETPPIDLIFMDIELGDGQSFQIFDTVKFHAPVIFITAYQQHALKAFRQNSVDYLLKPLHQADLQRALSKFTNCYFRQPFKSGEAEHSAGVCSFYSPRKRFLTKTGTRLISVPTENIAYFYTKNKLHFIKTKNSEDLLIDKHLEDVEAEVDSQLFFRVNRQFIVQYDAIEKVNAWFSGKLKLQVTPAPYEDIIVSRLKASDFKRWLGE